MKESRAAKKWEKVLRSMDRCQRCKCSRDLHNWMDRSFSINICGKFVEEDNNVA